MNIVIYDNQTGAIHRCVACPDGMQEVQCGPSEDWLEHEWVDDSKYKVDLATLEVVPIVAEDGAT